MFLMNIPVVCFHQAYMIQVLHQLNQDKAIFLMLYHIAVLLFPLYVVKPQALPIIITNKTAN